MPQLPMIPFTKIGLANLKQEEQELKVRRAEAVKRVQIAREMGDLSENGAYKYGKLEISDVSRRLREISFLLQSAEVIEPEQHDQIAFGHQVTLKSDKGEVTYQMVSQYESDPSLSRLSIDSPLGKALMGKKVGDNVDLNLPAGTVTYQVVKIA